MQLSMGYDRIDGKKLLFLLCSLFLVVTLQAQNQDFSRVKSKYDFKTEATEKLSELVAAKKYDEALAFANQKIDKASKDGQYEELVLLLERKADLFRRLQQFEEGEKTATDAIKIAREKLGQKHILLAKSYLTRGIIEHRRNDFYTASYNLDSAQLAYKIAIQYDSSMYDRIIEYKYYTYSYSERNVDTLKKYIDIRLNNKLNDKNATPEDILYLMDDIPDLYSEKGDFPQALAYSIEEVSYAEKYRAQIAASSYLRSYYNLVYTLYQKKEFDLALKICENILEQFKLNPSESITPGINTLKSLKAAILTSLDRTEEGIAVYLELIDAYKDKKSNEKTVFSIQLKTNLAACYLQKDDFVSARHYLSQALEELKAKSEFPIKQASYIYSSLGQYFDRLDNKYSSLMSYDSAIRNGIPEFFDKPILDFPKLHNQKVSFNVLLELKHKAISLKDLFKYEFRDSVELLLAANNYSIKVHEILLKKRKELMRTEGRLFLSENFKPLYESGIESSFELVKLGYTELGFEQADVFFEISKSILFLEQAGEFDQINENNIPQFLKESFYSLKIQNDELSRKFSKVFSEHNITSDSIETINKSILKNIDILKSLQDSISKFTTKSSVLIEKGMETKSMGQTITLNNHQALIEFFVGKDKIFILGKTFKKITLEKVNIDSVFLTAFNNVVGEISSRPHFFDYQNKITNFSKDSYYLFKLLLEPTLEKLGGNIDQITFIPDEYLSRLPFETLLTRVTIAKSFKELPYLIKTHSINYRLTSRQGFKIERDKAKKNILGIGYSQEKNLNNNTVIQLPGTDKEIQEIQSMFDGDYFLGEDGTKKLFLNRAKDYDILHIAVHGQSDVTGKYESQLIFNGRDSILNTGDLYLADLNARLAILSACQSGTGVIREGEGTLSIARGFALVGIPSIIMSLWNLNDKVSSEIMVDFHQFLKDGQSSNSALSLAKLKYLEKTDNYTSHPYYWSSFISLGKPMFLDEQNDNNSNKLYLIYTFIILIFGIILFVQKKRKRTIK